MLLILVALLFHVWSCQSSLSFFSGILQVVRSCQSSLDTVLKHCHRVVTLIIFCVNRRGYESNGLK